MASIILSQLICTIALIVLIIVLPITYSGIQNDIQASVMRIELKEIADYVSSTIANTYYLANSTNCPVINLTKTLVHLPETVQSSFFEIHIDGNITSATSVTVSVKDRPYVQATAWLSSGLMNGGQSIESGKGVVSAGCYRNSTGIYAQLGLEGIET